MRTVRASVKQTLGASSAAAVRDAETNRFQADLAVEVIPGTLCMTPVLSSCSLSCWPLPVIRRLWKADGSCQGSGKSCLGTLFMARCLRRLSLPVYSLSPSREWWHE